MKQLRTAHFVVCILVMPFLGLGIALVIVTTKRINMISEWYYTPGLHNDTNFHPSDEYPPMHEMVDTVPSKRFVRDTSMEFENVTGINNTMPIALARSKYAYLTAYEHGLLSMTAMIVFGLSLVIYRLLQNVRTSNVKIMHVMLHTIACLLIGFGVWQVYDQEYCISYTVTDFHCISSWVVIGLLILQILTALFVFMYDSISAEMRMSMAPFHDIFGVWLYISMVCSCVSGITLAKSDFEDDTVTFFYLVSYTTFTIIIVITLSPYFEWKLIGPL